MNLNIIIFYKQYWNCDNYVQFKNLNITTNLIFVIGNIKLHDFKAKYWNYSKLE